MFNSSDIRFNTICLFSCEICNMQSRHENATDCNLVLQFAVDVASCIYAIKAKDVIISNFKVSHKFRNR